MNVVYKPSNAWARSREWKSRFVFYINLFDLAPDKYIKLVGIILRHAEPRPNRCNGTGAESGTHTRLPSTS